jgi:hypothetical protein
MYKKPKERLILTSVNQHIARLNGVCTGVCNHCSQKTYGSKLTLICNYERRMKNMLKELKERREKHV